MCRERLQSAKLFPFCSGESPSLTSSSSDYAWPIAQVTNHGRCPGQSPFRVYTTAETGECETHVPGSSPVLCLVRDRRQRVCHNPVLVCLLLGLTYPRKPGYFCFPLKNKGLVSPLEGKLTISVIPLAIQGSVTFLGAAAES